MVSLRKAHTHTQYGTTIGHARCRGGEQSGGGEKGDRFLVSEMQDLLAKT